VCGRPSAAPVSRERSGRQRAHSLYSADGTFRSAQLEVKLTIERALELMSTFLSEARDLEDDDADKIVLTMFAHPPAQ
jgi:hypothetical protein